MPRSSRNSSAQQNSLSPNVPSLGSHFLVDLEGFFWEDFFGGQTRAYFWGTFFFWFRLEIRQLPVCLRFWPKSLV